MPFDERPNRLQSIASGFWQNAGMDALLLEELIKWTGIGVALAGAILTSPDGTRRLVRGLWLWIQKVFLRRVPQPAHNATVTMESHLTGRDSLTAELMWGPDSPLDHRIEILRGRIEGLKAELTDMKSELGGRLNVHDQILAQLSADIDETRRMLHTRIDISEEKSAQIDAFGLPIIGLGILLSGVPQELAAVAWLGVPLTAFSIVMTIAVLVHGIRQGAWK
ncbi:hypothetical protein [Arthrobacter sp. B2a2-09]|uniref:hypothetical protein n=1 Tax=Arthrobacter sp. B2a2-09 TaxID=2952822 RepID=UPI0022CD27DF|nr:hypothetical protein [Arthrobacter sp. B2a2-09]MCZ9880537.1 hypothetical protein [Arthrobacter sp. B2a2-09]